MRLTRMRIWRACSFVLALTAGCGGAPAVGGGTAWEVPAEDLKRKAPAGAELIGTEHPYTVEVVTPRFVILCQAREDTDKDGKTRVSMGLHGDTWGDQLVPY